MNNQGPVVLVILDGWGEWDMPKGNPFIKAQTPTIDRLNKQYPKTILQASGMAVGLPWGVCGNSEVGHQTIGSGQILFQFLPSILASIGDGSFFKNEILRNCVKTAKQNRTDLHLFGLLSDGGVHSHIDHLFALLDLAKKEDFKNVFIHVVTDGRDVHFQSAKKYLKLLQDKIDKIGIGKIATIAGRYFAMDRNNNWDRTKKAFDAMCLGSGIKEKDIFTAIENQYEKDVRDENIEPVVVIDENDMPVGVIKNNDSVICFNFRKDRSRQIVKAFVKEDFKEFEKTTRPNNLNFVCFAEYEKGLETKVAFEINKISTRLGEIIARANKKQLRIAETEKYAHVTYFFNGGVETPYPGEDRELILSKNIPRYDKDPAMSVFEIQEKLSEKIDEEKYDFILVNFANADMVGHTGNIGAATLAIELIDKCLGKLVDKVLAKNGELIITADHGNVEEMLDVYTGEIDTKHSKNPVPLWYVGRRSFSNNDLKGEVSKEIEGMLIDIAPTILELMSLDKPEKMIGVSLLDNLRNKIK